MTSIASSNNAWPDVALASRNFARLMEHIANLYCSGESSSISALEFRELTFSVSYALGIANATEEEAACALSVTDPIALWHEAVAELEARVDASLELWREVVATMPPIRNIALRDTLASLGNIKQCYDVYFAAHEVPCSIDYQLHEPIKPVLLGLDYIEAWLSRLLVETKWIAQFDAESCISVLNHVCPDYRGLHVNLYDLLFPHEDELVR